jgi:hypothetical protein
LSIYCKGIDVNFKCTNEKGTLERRHE